MSACSLKMRLFICFTLSAALTISRGITAQEPSPALKQADADYRAGVAALSRNDLNTAFAVHQDADAVASSFDLFPGVRAPASPLLLVRPDGVWRYDPEW
jgi:hypothetical protein